MAKYNINSFIKWIRETDYGLPYKTDMLCILLTFTYINNINRLTPNISQSLYYMVVIVINCGILALTLRRGVRISIPMWLFWLFMWVSILMNMDEIGAYFKAPARTMSFLLVQLIVAPFFVSEQLNHARDRIFDVFNFLILCMAIISFLGRFFNFLPTDNQGFYLGCTWHSMDLAAIMGIAVITFMHHIAKTRQNRKLKKIYIGCFAGSFLVLLLSSSRTTLISCTIAVLGYWCSGASQTIQKVFKPAILIGLMIYGVSIVFPDAFKGMLNKSRSDSGQITTSSITKSRFGIWNDRIQEIKDYPLFGTGAHTIRHGRTSFNGQIEPGNAWLYVFSSMGVFQFAVFCGIIVNAFKRCRKHAIPGHKASLIMALLVYFCMYMVGEAHITAAGEFTCIYFWLLIAVALYHDFHRDIIFEHQYISYETHSA